MEVLAGSPRLLRNLNEKAVLERLLDQGSLTRMELEAFTGLSKPAVSDLLRRLESAGLIRKDGEKAGTYGPKAGLWSLEPRSACVAGVGVTPHGLDVAVADITGNLLAEVHSPKKPSELYQAGPELHRVIDEATRAAGISIKNLDQVVVGLPGIVDIQTGHLRKGQQLRNWEGFDIPASLMSSLGHNHVVVENDVNLVALEEMAVGAAKGVQTFVLFWVGEGVGGALVQAGRLVRGTTGSAGELGGAIVPERIAAPGEAVRVTLLENLLSVEGIEALLAEHGLSGGDHAEAVARAVRAAEQHAAFIEELAYRFAVGLAGAIGILDPDMVVLAGDIGQAGGRALAQRVSALLARLPIALPQIVPTAVSENAVRAGAIELALEYTRERVFTGGSAARGLP